MPKILFKNCFSLSLFLAAALAAPIGAETLSERAAALPDWSISNKTIQRSSKPFFPLGIYYVAHSPKAQERRLRDLTMIAAAGFNVIYTPIDMDDGAFLDACAAANVAVIAEFNHEIPEIVKQFGDHPALMGWAAFDDVDAKTSFGARRHPVGQVRKRTGELSLLTPRLLTYISGGYPRRLPQYAGAADLIALQVYPIPFEPLDTVAEAYLGPFGQKMHQVGQLIIANVQLFGWHGRQALPNGDELRNMTYQSLIGGVKGLLYYTFFDKFTDLHSQPALWGEVRSLVAELGAMQPFFLRRRPCVFQSDRSNVVAGLWTGETGQQLMIAVNTDREVSEARVRGCPWGPDLKPLGNSAPPMRDGEDLILHLKPEESARYLSEHTPAR